jgi:hypothetical protein
MKIFMFGHHLMKRPQHNLPLLHNGRRTSAFFVFPHCPTRWNANALGRRKNDGNEGDGA